MLDVLLLSPLPPPVGGIARWSETVIEYFEDEGTINLIHINTSHKVKTIVGRNVFQRYISSFFQIFKLKKKIKVKLRDNSVKVAHITTSGGLGVIRDYCLIKFLNSKRIKIVYHLHFGKTPQLLESKRLTKKIFEFNLKRATLIMAMDPITLGCLHTYEKKVFCPNPIKKQEFSYTKNKEIIFLGYVVKSKGIEELLKAWSEIYPCNKEWKLNIIGACNREYRVRLEEKYNLDGVFFIGEKAHSEAMKIMKDASILVLPSYSEGFPYSICEAMFAGKAIIGSNVGAIPYLLDCECGLICKRADYESLKEKLLLFLESEELRNSCAKKAYEKAICEIESDVVCKRYAELWKGL